MTEPTALPETAISRRRLLAFSAVAIPAGALLTHEAKKAAPKTAPKAETRPAARPSATVAAPAAAPSAPVYFC
jgi:hypothetical protein